MSGRDRGLPDPVAEPTTTPQRWADVLQMSVRAVYAAIERGEIPSIRVGQSVRIPTQQALDKLGLAAGQPPQADIDADHEYAAIGRRVVALLAELSNLAGVVSRDRTGRDSP